MLLIRILLIIRLPLAKLTPMSNSAPNVVNLPEGIRLMKSPMMFVLCTRLPWHVESCVSRMVHWRSMESNWHSNLLFFLLLCRYYHQEAVKVSMRTDVQDHRFHRRTSTRLQLYGWINEQPRHSWIRRHTLWSWCWVDIWHGKETVTALTDRGYFNVVSGYDATLLVLLSSS